MTNGDSLTKTNRGTMNSLIVFLLWIVFFHSTSCNAFVFGVQSFQSQKMLNKIDFFIFETISKNGHSHAIDKMSQIKEEERLILLPNNGPATETSSFSQHPNNDGPAQFKQLSVSNDGRAITTLSFLHLHVPFRTATHKKLLLLPVLEGSSIIMATHMTHANFLLLSIRDNPAITVDNSAITTATRTQNLLLYAQIGSAITMVTHTQNLLLFCVQDDPAITMATSANFKLHLIVAFIQRALTAQITFIDPFSVSEEARHAQINLQTFRLIIDYICCPNFVGAHQVTSSTIPNDYFKLIDILASEKALCAPCIFDDALTSRTTNKSIFEGAGFAPTSTFRPSITDLQLIVEFNDLILNSEGTNAFDKTLIALAFEGALSASNFS